MAKQARKEEGDEVMGRANRELTVISTGVVARSRTPCGCRNQGNRAAAPARRKLRLRRLQWLLDHHLRALGVDDVVAREGHGLRAPLRRWLRLLTAANGGRSRGRRGKRGEEGRARERRGKRSTASRRFSRTG